MEIMMDFIARKFNLKKYIEVKRELKDPEKKSKKKKTLKDYKEEQKRY